ncbi:EAL domain-containing protein [Pseudoalteromonas sp. J010]|uniref:bifunctional diguanylate cyclase/phosphodiesterase n=1 Tax=Pseudoalteromonas sp. J010 TaxID=998465 RepID=UPI00163B396E|nr:EAL domain-containing protein [Pseudoalteromonas sp. J010]
MVDGTSHEEKITPEQAAQCAQEQIQYIGSIQPYGFVIVVDIETQKVITYSENVEEMLRHNKVINTGEKIKIMGSSMSDWAGKLDLDSIPAHGGHFQVDIQTSKYSLATEWECLASRIGQCLTLEFLPLCKSESSQEILTKLDKMVNNIRGAKNLSELCDSVAEQFQHHTEYHRVMIYRFMPDGSGEVVSESCAAGFDVRFLGMRFPAEDIPKQARELYKTNSLRVMADVDAVPVPLVTNTLPDGSVVDQSMSILRSMSLMHVAYLKNMGVKATLSSALMYEGELWGLIACHHYERKVPPTYMVSQTKISCELFSEIASSYLAPSLNIDLMQRKLTIKHEIDLAFIGNKAGSHGDFQTILQQAFPHLGYDAVGIIFDGDCALQSVEDQSVSQSQELKWYQSILEVIESNQEELYESCNLQKTSNISIKFSESENVAGVLVLRSKLMPNLIVFFAAKEQISRIAWAGKPDTVSIVIKNGERHLEPRSSFALWNQTVRGESEQWSELDKELIHYVYEKCLERAILIRNNMQRLELYNSAYRDPLTKLHNRRYIDIYLENLRCGHEKVLAISLLFIDLDNFKRINDFYGHSVGDELLKESASRLLESVRANDLVVRIGGDEFIVMIVHSFDDIEVNKTIAGTIATKFIKEIAKPVSSGECQMVTTPSIGIVTKPFDEFILEEVMQDADIAMYKAKQAGKNKYHQFDDTDKLQVMEEGQLEIELRMGIKHRTVDVYFQPQFDFKTKKVVGTEVLARWHHPTLGFISPERFISLAEKVGIINELGSLIFEKVCETLREWADKSGKPLVGTYSINVSLLQLFDPQFTDNLIDSTYKFNINPNLIRLEITESIFIRDFEQAIKIIIKLKKYGFTFSLDDFGTGYSSLSYLQKLPVDEVKIDKSFVLTMTEDNTSLTMVSSIIDLCKKLNLRIVAEGVENSMQVTLLEGFGCNVAQGFYFGKPMPRFEFFNMFIDSENYAAS